jgi:serine protease Do
MDSDGKFGDQYDDQYNDQSDTINESVEPRNPESIDGKPEQEEPPNEPAYDETSTESDPMQEPLNEPEQHAALTETYPVQPQPLPGHQKSGRGISTRKLFALLVLASLIGSLLTFMLIYAGLPRLLISRGLLPIRNGDIQQINISPSDDISVYSAVAQKAMPSVVGVTMVQLQQGTVFGTRRAEGLGTGVIVDERGYILTNSHVIGDGQADEVTVLLHDGNHYPAEVLWYEQTMDLAVIKIDGGINLVPAELGDSDELIVGEIAVAIGNPLGLNFERTLTQGVVSGLNRSIPLGPGMSIDGLIQTDASINPGNSGGPLLNAQGQVIGINTAKMQTGEGLGFSIPINTAKPIVDQFIERGEFRRVYLGVRGFNVQSMLDTNDSMNTAETGVYVIEVVEGSAAEEAQLSADDIVIGLGNIRIETMGDLIKELYKYRPGDQTTVTILRNGEEITIDIVLQE